MPTPKRNWVIMTGGPLNSADSAGFELFGPFTQAEALKLRKQITAESKIDHAFSRIVMAIELLGYYNRQLGGEAAKATQELPLL